MKTVRRSVWRLAMDRTRQHLGIQRGAVPPSESNFCWKRFQKTEVRLRAEKRVKEAKRKRNKRKALADAAGRTVRQRTSFVGMDEVSIAAHNAAMNRKHQKAYRARKTAKAGLNSASGSQAAIIGDAA